MEGTLPHEYHIEPWQIRRFEVKGNLTLTLSEGDPLTIPLRELQASVRTGCAICTDFTALDSDLSAGAVGSETGYTTLIIRTPVGQGFLDQAIHSGGLVTGPPIDLKAIERMAAKKGNRRETRSTPGSPEQ
jgi:coenzyme F420 hydrogenase subunit beta